MIVTGLVYWLGWRRVGAQTLASSIIITAQDVSDEQRREGNGNEKFTSWSVDPTPRNTPRNSSHTPRNSFREEKGRTESWDEKEGNGKESAKSSDCDDPSSDDTLFRMNARSDSARFSTYFQQTASWRNSPDNAPSSNSQQLVSPCYLSDHQNRNATGVIAERRMAMENERSSSETKDGGSGEALKTLLSLPTLSQNNVMYPFRKALPVGASHSFRRLL